MRCLSIGRNCGAFYMYIYIFSFNEYKKQSWLKIQLKPFSWETGHALFGLFGFSFAWFIIISHLVSF